VESDTGSRVNPIGLQITNLYKRKQFFEMLLNTNNARK